jgi:hypothetical protein
MFRDFKKGGYNLEDTNVSGERLITLILLILNSDTKPKCNECAPGGRVIPVVVQLLPDGHKFVGLWARC